MSNKNYNIATLADEYSGILGDINTLIERGADGSNEVDRVIATLSLVSSAANFLGKQHKDIGAFSKGYGLVTDILLTELALAQMFKNIENRDVKGVISNAFFGNIWSDKNIR